MWGVSEEGMCVECVWGGVFVRGVCGVCLRRECVWDVCEEGMCLMR